MRQVSNYKKDKLRKEQLFVLIEVLEKIKNSGDMKLFLKTFLTDSELAYLGQRLNIMRMLAKNFSYIQISEKLNVPANTISNAKKYMDEGGEELKKVILSYKYKPRKVIQKKKDDVKMTKSHYPGAIRF